MASQAGQRPGSGPPVAGGPPGGGQGGPPGGWGSGAPQAERGGPFRAMRPFRYGSYTVYWAGSILSITSFFMLIIARGWLTFDITSSDLWVSIVSATSLIPALFLSIVGGVIADRFNRKHILIASEISNFATHIALALLVLTELIEVWHLVALSVLHGTMFALSSPARFSIVPSLVPPNLIANATALSSIMFSGGALMGPVAAGFLLDVEPAYAFFAGAALVGVSAPLFLLIKLNAAPAWGQGHQQGGVFENVLEGLRHIRQRKILLGLVLVGMVATFFGMPYQALLPVFAEEVLEAGPRGLGWLGMAGGIGGTIGSLLIATFSSVNQLKAWLVVGALGVGLFIAGFAQATWFADLLGLDLSGAFIIALIFAGVAGWFFQMVMTGNFSLVQVLTPDQLRGRVMSVRLIVFGFQPFALIITGVIAEIYGAPFAVTLTGLGLFICAVALLSFFPSLRRKTDDAVQGVGHGPPSGRGGPPNGVADGHSGPPVDGGALAGRPPAAVAERPGGPPPAD